MGVNITNDVIYLIASSFVIQLHASVIDPVNFFNIFVLISSLISKTIFLQISLSEMTPSALNTINSGIGFLTRGIERYIV